MRQTLTIAPAEIARQLALCDQIRALLDQRPGQKLAYVDTYGCQQNEADSERLRGVPGPDGLRLLPHGGGGGPGIAEHLRHPGARRAAGVRQRGGPDPHQAPASGAGDLSVRLHGPAGPCGPAAAPVLSPCGPGLWPPAAVAVSPAAAGPAHQRQAGLCHRGCARGSGRGHPGGPAEPAEGLGVHHVRLQQLLYLLHRPLRPGPGA